MKPPTRFSPVLDDGGPYAADYATMLEDERGSYYAKEEADARIRHFQDEALCAEEAALSHARRIAELEAENLHTENLYAREIERRKDAEAEGDAARADAERLRGELLAAASVLETCRYSEQPAAKRARDAARSKP